MPKPRSNTKANAQDWKKPDRSLIGAPSQHSQSSRKGKRAWRKNVSIEDVEQGLESIRTEERVTGLALQKTQDSDLFQIDLKGDDRARKSLRKFSAAQLTSTKILAQRSAVPAVLSRITSSNEPSKRKSPLSPRDKEKLIRIAKRPRKGPFNSILDPAEYGAGSSIVGLSEAVKQSGRYDAWAPEPLQPELEDGLETIQKPVLKAPIVKTPREIIKIPAVPDPHQGASYNPPADAHHELLLKAAAVEAKRVNDAETLASIKSKVDAARTDENAESGWAAGMKVQEMDDGVERGEGDLESRVLNLLPQKKTKSQRAKESRLLAEKRALSERVERRKQLASIDDAKSIRRETTRFMTERARLREKRRLGLIEKLQRQGLTGQKIGKHKVPESKIDVQLGENLSESLRGLKAEGNLFRDRFESLQRRALIEPRVRVLPTKRKRRVIEYEKHAWKKFE